MALNTYVNVFKGQKTTDVKGNCTQDKRVGWIEVIAFNHEITSPRDAASGLATGKRMHKPITFTVAMDKSYPLLYNILCQNELVTEVNFKFYSATQLGQRAIAGGQEYNVFDIKIQNGHISNMQLRMPNNKNPELMRYDTYCEISMTYQKITWTWNDGGITAMDDWEAPVA